MERSDRELYNACRHPNPHIQSEAYTLLWQQLYRIAWAMLREQSEGEALAHDCTQTALIKINQRLESCQNPDSFRAWANQVLRRTVIDELRRPEHSRKLALPDDHDEAANWLVAPTELLHTNDLRNFLYEIIQNGPLSARSRRVVLGRYFEEKNDEQLSALESQQSQQPVLPSHIQVTRAKDLAALRRDPAILNRLRELL
jgi:RNA polymerase sigma factor (sigma-70 family)